MIRSDWISSQARGSPLDLHISASAACYTIAIVYGASVAPPTLYGQYEILIHNGSANATKMLPLTSYKGSEMHYSAQSCTPRKEMG